MRANDIQDTGVLLPRIADVRTDFPFVLIVTWAEGNRAGQVDRVDVSPVISTYKIFKPLKNRKVSFETAHLDEYGDAVLWNGKDLELSAEVIEELAEQTMTPKDFVAFMKRNSLTETAAASILGYSRRQIGYYKTTGPIPRIVALACRGFEGTKREKKGASKKKSAAA